MTEALSLAIDEPNARDPRVCVYVIYTSEFPDPYRMKVGVSRDWETRLNDLGTASPIGLIMEDYWWFTSRPLALQTEALLHGLMRDFRIKGEWFAQNEIPWAVMEDSCRWSGADCSDDEHLCPDGSRKRPFWSAPTLNDFRELVP